MANVKNNALAQDTRRRLIEAAGEVFAAHGLHGATIKQITDRAGANVAAVNYHFRDKDELFVEVMRHAHARTLEELRLGNIAGSPEARLRRFIRGFMEHLMAPDRPSWHARLFWRELAQPTSALEHILDTVIRPQSRHLRQIVGTILKRDPDHEEVVLASCSIVAQCLFHFYNRPVNDRIYAGVKALRDPQRVADHISRFSLAALRSRRRAGRV